MTKKHTISIFAIVIILVIGGFFLLSIPKIKLYYSAFFALLFSLMISLVSILSIEHKNNDKDDVFYSFSVSTVTFIYLIAIVTSLFFIKSFKDSISQFVFLQLIINGIYFIFIIMILVAAKDINQREAIEFNKKQNGEYNKPKRGGN